MGLIFQTLDDAHNAVKENGRHKAVEILKKHLSTEKEFYDDLLDLRKKIDLFREHLSALVKMEQITYSKENADIIFEETKTDVKEIKKLISKLGQDPRLDE